MNSNSCSFPAIAVASLLYIDRRQEHNNAGRIRQFGELYDRWSSLRLGGRRLRLEPLMRLEPSGLQVPDRYEPNKSFYYEIMSIIRRGGWAERLRSSAASCTALFRSGSRSVRSHRCMGRGFAASSSRGAGEFTASIDARPIRDVESLAHS